MLIIREKGFVNIETYSTKQAFIETVKILFPGLG